MKVDNQLILKLEELSRLQLSEDERAILVKDLERILEMVDKLKELDTSNVEPLLHLTEAINAFRDDKKEQNFNSESALKNAPLSKGNYFAVPKVIDRGDEN